MTKHILRTGLIALVAGVCLQAAGPQFSLGGSLNLVQGSLKDQQVGGMGFGLHADLTFQGEVPFRAGLGLGSFPGSASNGKENSLAHTQLYGDTLVKLPVEGLQLVAGLSFNQWKVEAKSPKGTYDHSVKGIKFGARLGVEYAFTKAITGQCLIQATELGTTSVFVKDASERVGPEGINPTWIQVGVRYTF